MVFYGSFHKQNLHRNSCKSPSLPARETHCSRLPRTPVRTPNINHTKERYALSQTLHVAVGREDALFCVTSSVKEDAIHLKFVQNETDRQQQVQLLIVAALQKATDQVDDG